MNYHIFCLLFVVGCVGEINISFDDKWETFMNILNETRSRFEERNTEKFRRSGDKYYLIRWGKLSWIEAFVECRKFNSQLAIIDSFATAADLLRTYTNRDYLKAYSFWIGASDHFEKRHFRWFSNGNHITRNISMFTPFVEADDYHCLLVTTLESPLPFALRNQNCKVPLPFICEKTIPPGITVSIWVE